MEADKVTTFKIYAGNLPDETAEDDVRKIFEEFGNVVHCECVGRKAFIYMEDDIEGKHAIGELQGREFNGNTLTIEEARKNETPPIPAVKLLVKNISSGVDARGLRNMFKRFGYVLEVEINNGEGHVNIEAVGDIRSAISEMNGYKIEDTELSVEPAPIEAESDVPTTREPESQPTANSPKKNKNRGYGNWDSSWSRAKQEYYASERHRQDFNSFDHCEQVYDDPWGNPDPSPFNQQPERILRDPYARPRRMHRPPFANAPRGGRMPRGPMGLGPRGPPPPRMLPPAPSFLGPPMGRMPGPGRIMRSGNQPSPYRGAPMRGPRPQFRADPYNEPSFFRRDEQEHVQPNNPFVQEDFEEEVFYEDEPVSSVARSMNQYSSGANSIPLGGMGPGQRSPWSNFTQRNGNTRGGARGRGGRGQGRPPKFTAVTEDVTPGEKYPVPPMHNPGFRAPIKRSKDENPIRRKGNKKKKPLVPAELPDYSVPVPELPRQSVPRGAVLKAFPPPLGHSVIDSDTFGGSGSSSFFGYEQNQKK